MKSKAISVRELIVPLGAKTTMFQRARAQAIFVEYKRGHWKLTKNTSGVKLEVTPS